MNKQRPFCLVRIIDDDAGVRDSYRYLIESDGWLVRTYQDAEDFLANDDPSIPGCAILDVRMPGLSGLELQNYLNKLARNLPIVFVSAHGDIEMAVRAMRHGAIDFLPKPVDDDKLLASLELAIEASIQNSQQAHDIQDAKTRWSLLSPREQEVARLVAQGKLNKIIADELGISERTVQAHRANACQKLGVRHAVGLLQMIEKAEQ